MLFLGKFDEVYNKLKSAATSSSGKFDVYKKDQLPDRWHMKNNARLTGIIFLLAKTGYAFVQSTSEESSKFIPVYDVDVMIRYSKNYELSRNHELPSPPPPPLITTMNH